MSTESDQPVRSAEGDTAHLPPPIKVEWRGPEFWTVIADEDGAHLRTRSGDRLESCDVARLFDLWQQVQQAIDKKRNLPAPTRSDLPF